MVDFDLWPSRTALVNVDMQCCFVEGYRISVPDGPAVLQRVNRVAAACRKAGIVVIHTSMVYRPDGSNVGVVQEFDPVSIESGILNKGAESAALHPGLIVEQSDILLDKPRFGAFHMTDLELILRARGIDSVIVTGLATNICCESTAREAAVRNFRVFFLSDGTATFGIGDLTAADLQKATCATLGLLFAQVLTVDEMVRKIESAMQRDAG
jgi:ureidoacrylate peracid hydrolase